jgi:hypothetical protein
MEGCAQCLSSTECQRCTSNSAFLLDEDNSPGFEKCVPSCEGETGIIFLKEYRERKQLNKNITVFLGKDRFAKPAGNLNVCQLCSKLTENPECIECYNEKICSKCKANPFLPRFLETSKDRNTTYCVKTCSPGALNIDKSVDGTGKCEFCTYLVDSSCKTCTFQMDSVRFSPFFYRCLECSEDKMLTFTKRDVLTDDGYQVSTYQVNCSLCNTSTNTYIVENGTCLPCEKKWTGCHTCRSE